MGRAGGSGGAAMDGMENQGADTFPISSFSFPSALMSPVLVFSRVSLDASSPSSTPPGRFRLGDVASSGLKTTSHLMLTRRWSGVLITVPSRLRVVPYELPQLCVSVELSGVNDLHPGQGSKRHQLVQFWACSQILLQTVCNLGVLLWVFNS